MATKRIIALAKAAALKSPFRWKVGAVAYSGSRILGIGVNDMLKTSPSSFHPFKTRHAEFNALYKIPKPDRRGISLYVHRVGRDGLDHNAKPCSACQKMIAWSEVRNVEWSVDPCVTSIPF